MSGEESLILTKAPFIFTIKKTKTNNITKIGRETWAHPRDKTYRVCASVIKNSRLNDMRVVDASRFNTLLCRTSDVVEVELDSDYGVRQGCYLSCHSGQCHPSSPCRAGQTLEQVWCKIETTKTHRRAPQEVISAWSHPTTQLLPLSASEAVNTLDCLSAIYTHIHNCTQHKYTNLYFFLFVLLCYFHSGVCIYFDIIYMITGATVTKSEPPWD